MVYTWPVIVSSQAPFCFLPPSCCYAEEGKAKGWYSFAWRCSPDNFCCRRYGLYYSNTMYKFWKFSVPAAAGEPEVNAVVATPITTRTLLVFIKCNYIFKSCRPYTKTIATPTKYRSIGYIDEANTCSAKSHKTETITEASDSYSPAWPSPCSPCIYICLTANPEISEQARCLSFIHSAP